MIKSWKNPLLCIALTVILVALLMHTTAFAGALPFGREKLKGQTTAEGNLATQQQYIADAQNLTFQAYDKVVAAERIGKWDGLGHAKKAEELLVKAQNELKLAAEAPAPK
jgi:hypothetical protein